MERVKLIIVAFISTLLVASCGDSSSDVDDDVLVYQVSVAAQPDYFNSNVMHTAPLNALAVGQGGPDTRANNIFGFKHSFGTQYELEIRRYQVVMAGGQAGVAYELIRIISSQRDTVGTVYQYPLFELISSPISKRENGIFRISPYDFFCAENVDCETLVNMGNDGGLVTLEFTLTDNGTVPITLTNWQ